MYVCCANDFILYNRLLRRNNLNFLFSILIGVLAGIFCSMGFGGGTVLILYFVLFTGITQKNAQGINMLCFLPVAAASLFFHYRNKMINIKILPYILITGISGSITGAFISNLFIDSDMLRKVFAVFLLVIGVIELFSRKETVNVS